MQQTWFISISILFVSMGQGPWEPESWLISSRNDANPLWMSELNLASTGRQCAKMD